MDRDRSMAHVLFLLPNLQDTDASRAACRLADGLLAGGERVSVAALGATGVAAEAFRSLGIAPQCWEQTAWTVLRTARPLRQWLKKQAPNIVHLWGIETCTAWRWAFLGHRRPPAVWTDLPQASPETLPRWLRWLGGTTERPFPFPLIAASEAAVQIRSTPSLRDELQLPATAQLIVSVGSFDHADAFRDAIWAFDILKYCSPQLHLVLIGDGPTKAEHILFAQRMAGADCRVYFLPERADTLSLLAQADFVWSTDPRGGHISTILDAWALEKPVLVNRTASIGRWANLEQLAWCFEPNDREQLARLTRRLWENRTLARERCALARAWVRQHADLGLAVQTARQEYQAALAAVLGERI